MPVSCSASAAFLCLALASLAGLTSAAGKSSRRGGNQLFLFSLSTDDHSKQLILNSRASFSAAALIRALLKSTDWLLMVNKRVKSNRMETRVPPSLSKMSAACIIELRGRARGDVVDRSMRRLFFPSGGDFLMRRFAIFFGCRDSEPTKHNISIPPQFSLFLYRCGVVSRPVNLAGDPTIPSSIRVHFSASFFFSLRPRVDKTTRRCRFC